MLTKFARVLSCVALVVVIAGVPTGSASAAPPGGAGAIAGRVVDAHGDPLDGICVQLENGPSTTTDVLGDYSFNGLMPGTYRLSYDDCVDHLLMPQWHFKADDANGSQPVNVMPGLTTTLTDEPMFLGATVSGTVSRAGTGGPLGGICVDVTRTNSGGFDVLGGTTTLSDGSYEIHQLPSANARVRFHSCATNGPEVEQWNGGAFNHGSADDIALTTALDVTGVDAALSQGVGVTGTVTDGQGGPIAGITVSINLADGDGPTGWAVTDVNGGYQTSALPPGDYLVEFKDDDGSPYWATQYWTGRSIRHDADVLTLDLADGPHRNGIDAQLAIGATISGTVTAPGGAPVSGHCVVAVDGDERLIGIAGTASDGTYTITGLPATSARVVFVDCGDPQLHVQQWWENAGGPHDATTITLAAGEHRTGIDAVVRLAGFVAGTVTDQGGNPIENACVTALGTTAFGGAVRTEADGTYAMPVSGSGPYLVQFVDCRDTPTLAGQWYDGTPDGRASKSGAQGVTVSGGQTVGGVDARLLPGTNGSVSGRVVNRHDVAMTNVCVIAYLPDNHVRFGMVGSDGTYTVADIPSGAYGLAFMDCSGTGDPDDSVPDPEVSATVYRGLWWGGRPVTTGRSTRFDPVEQGATLIEIGAGAHLTDYDLCFGCVAITISSVTPAADTVSVAFTVEGPALAASMSWLSSVGYTATCQSSDGGVTRSATGSSSPIVVTGLTPGARYTCTVTASDTTSPVGRSTPSAPVTLAGSSTVMVPIPTASPTPATTVPVTAPSAAPRQLAMTGGNPGVTLTIAGILFIVGGLCELGTTGTTRDRRRPTRRRGRAGSS